MVEIIFSQCRSSQHSDEDDITLDNPNIELDFADRRKEDEEIDGIEEAQTKTISNDMSSQDFVDYDHENDTKAQPKKVQRPFSAPTKGISKDDKEEESDKKMRELPIKSDEKPMILRTDWIKLNPEN